MTMSKVDAMAISAGITGSATARSAPGGFLGGDTTGAIPGSVVVVVEGTVVDVVERGTVVDVVARSIVVVVVDGTVVVVDVDVDVDVELVVVEVVEGTVVVVVVVVVVEPMVSRSCQ